ncbi:MAG TPA: phospholipase [Solirubrobacteraceae bacterium]|jgi:phospholipase/carboxylesterase|nr:phospholipase [Solirubrobacteraceae bacterium]
MTLVHRERPARVPAEGLLVLHHGRGADENDLLTLGDVLDPGGRLHVVTPRAPLQPAGAGGYHWYLVPRVGTPDPATFDAAFAALAAFHDELWEQTGIGPERTLLGGFSMGAVMSYALGLGPGRPVPAGLLAFSGFVPAVPGWKPDLPARRGLPVFIAHGRRDAVIDVSFGRAAQQLLSEGGLAVSYRESEAGHHIDPRELPAAQEWVQRTLAPPPPAA